MVIDAHYHLDERMETIERLISQMDQHGIDRIALIPSMVDPFHVDGIAEKMSNFVRKVLMGRWPGLGRLLLNITVIKKGKFSILGKMYDIYNRPDNNSLSCAMEKHPDRFSGWIFVNPEDRDPINEVEQWIGKPGWIGVKCHPFWHHYDVRKLDDTCACCMEKDIPLLIHLGGKNGEGDYRYLSDRHPDLKIIFAHAGIPYYKELWRDIKEKKNAYIDISSPYLDESLRNIALKALGPEKCIYGTDGPFGYSDRKNGQYDHGVILAEIERFPISDAEKRKIMGENFQEIANIN